jgi:hypothetical protein
LKSLHWTPFERRIHGILRKIQMIEKAGGVAVLRLAFVAALFAMLIAPVRAHGADTLPAKLDRRQFLEVDCRPV